MKDRADTSGREEWKKTKDFFFEEAGPLVGDDVDGFPLSNTKPCTVYHEFHVFDSDQPPPPPTTTTPVLPFHPLDAPNTVPFVSTGGGTGVMSVTNQHKEGCVSLSVSVNVCVCVVLQYFIRIKALQQVGSSSAAATWSNNCSLSHYCGKAWAGPTSFNKVYKCCKNEIYTI